MRAGNENLPPKTRRDFLKGVGILALGAGLGVGGSELISNSENKPEAPLERIYTDGDVIETEVSPVLIDGWHILVDNKKLDAYQDGLTKYNWEHYQSLENFPVQRSAMFEILNFTYEGEPVWVNSIKIGSSEVLETGFENPLFDQHPGTYHSMAVTPGCLRYLCLTEPATDNKPAKRNIFPIEIKDYGNGETVFCEKPIPKEQLKAIEKIQNQFAFITAPQPNIYLHRGIKGERNGQYISQEHSVFITIDHFENPMYKDEGLMVAFHECAHHFVETFRAMPQIETMTTEDDMERTRLLLKLFEAHKNYVVKAGFEYPLPQELFIPQDKNLEMDSLLGVLDESSYVRHKKKFDGGGHPYDNYSELFASTLSVMRFFPKQLVESYSKLPENQKPVIKDIVQTVIDMIYCGQYKKDVRALVPNIEAIKAAIV